MKKEKIKLRPKDENGLRHGKWIWYFKYTRDIEATLEYFHGKKHGIWEMYSKYTGKLYEKINYKMDKLYGLETQYKSDQNGEINFKKFHL